jgi:hypothetical protein
MTDTRDRVKRAAEEVAARRQSELDRLHLRLDVDSLNEVSGGWILYAHLDENGNAFKPHELHRLLEAVGDEIEESSGEWITIALN